MELAPISFFSVRIQSALVHGVAEYPNKHSPCGVPRRTWYRCINH